MFLPRHAAGNEDAEMADGLVDGVDDGLAAGAEVVVFFVEIDDPAQRLLRRSDVVALGAEAEDRRADVTQVDAHTVAGDDFGGGQPVADEQLIDDPLHFLGVEVDVPAPPGLEFQKALAFGIHARPEIVVLGPVGVGGIEILEVADQVGAVELAVSQIAGEGGQPTTAIQATGVAHGILAFHAGPVGQGGTGDDDRSEQFRPGRGQHHHRPASLAVADDAGFALGVGMKFDDLLQKPCLRPHDVFDGLAWHRVWREADEIAGMAGAHRHAEFAVGLETADAWSVAGARIDHHERSFFRVNAGLFQLIGPHQPVFGRRFAGFFRRLDPHQSVVDRPLEGPAVQYQFGAEMEDVGNCLGFMFEILVTAPPQRVPKQEGTLPGIYPVISHLLDRSERVLRGRSESFGHR